MINIPNKIADRLNNGIKRFIPVLQAAKSRDVGEADTVIIVTDILAYILGYDKYSEITSELAIKGTYCDLATKIDGKIQLLIEVKAIGLDLKDNYVRQAIDYASNQGIDWVVLTNGIHWKVFKVQFTKPIDQELILEFDFLALNSKDREHLDNLFFLSREGWLKSILNDYHAQKQALSKFFIASLVISESIIDVIRKELKKLSPDVKVDNEQIKSVLINEVLKREVVEGDKAEEAKKKIARYLTKMNKAKLKSANNKKPAEENNETTESIMELPE